jgi:5'(3')-deoxyribonucleotidase
METQLALVAYVLAVISLAVSVYVAYLLSELKDRINTRKDNHIQRQPTKAQKLKGHWD